MKSDIPEWNGYYGIVLFLHSWDRCSALVQNVACLTVGIAYDFVGVMVFHGPMLGILDLYFVREIVRIRIVIGYATHLVGHDCDKGEEGKEREGYLGKPHLEVVIVVVVGISMKKMR